MGCCGSVNVDHPASAAYIGKTRSNGLGKAFLILGVKDQNMKGKVYLSGAATSEPQLLESVDKALKKTNAGVTRASDEHDKLWDVAWHNTKMTSGYQFMSFKQPFFPIGRNVSRLHASDRLAVVFAGSLIKRELQSLSETVVNLCRGGGALGCPG